MDQPVALDIQGPVVLDMSILYLSREEAVKGRSRISRSRKIGKEVGMRLTLKTRLLI